MYNLNIKTDPLIKVPTCMNELPPVSGQRECLHLIDTFPHLVNVCCTRCWMGACFVLLKFVLFCITKENKMIASELLCGYKNVWTWKIGQHEEVKALVAELVKLLVLSQFSPSENWMRKNLWPVEVCCDSPCSLCLGIQTPVAKDPHNFFVRTKTYSWNWVPGSSASLPPPVEASKTNPWPYKRSKASAFVNSFPPGFHGTR